MAKKCLEDNAHIFIYRDIVPIVPFTMCDDLLAISECGYQTELMAAYLNSQARFNYLQFGHKKCFKLHIGKTKKRYQCQPVYLDGWESAEVENVGTQKVDFVEEYRGKLKITEVTWVIGYLQMDPIQKILLLNVI